MRYQIPRDADASGADGGLAEGREGAAFADEVVQDVMHRKGVQREAKGIEDCAFTCQNRFDNDVSKRLRSTGTSLSIQRSRTMSSMGTCQPGN